MNRTADLDRLDQLLADDESGSARVCVIAGTAGVGKTSLAVHWAHRARARFPDGQLYVNLRGYDPGAPISPARALEGFLEALGMPPKAIPLDLDARAAAFRSLLADRRVLVVLDNAATVGQVRPLLPGAGQCLTLITSRSRLSGLVARDGAQRLTLDVFDEPAALELLRGTTAGYRADEAQDIAELARLCARLPLALRVAAERAAARPRVPLGALIDDLRDESSLWDALSSEDDEEADAVRTVFAWSYRALPAEAARLFRLLGLHPTPEFSLHAAAAIAGLPPGPTRRQLDVLVGAHLLAQTASDRYQFHDLLRAYAIDQTTQLDTEEARRAALGRVLDWYLHTADALAEVLGRQWIWRIPPEERNASARPLHFAELSEGTEWFAAERKNLLASVRVASESGRALIAWQLPAVLMPAYTTLSQLEDLFEAGCLGLEAARRSNELRGEALLLVLLGMGCRQSHRRDEAIAHHRGALPLLRRLGDREAEAFVLNLLGLVHLDSHRFDEARLGFQDSVSLCEEIGYAEGARIARSNLGTALLGLGLADEAIALLRGAAEEARQAGNTYSHGNDLADLSLAYLESGRLEEAQRASSTALEIARSIGYAVLEAWVLIRHGRVQQASGQLDEALVSFQRSAVIHRRIGDRGREAEALDAAGTVYAELGREDEAVHFHRQAIATFRAIGDEWQTAVGLHHLASVLNALGENEKARAAWREALPLLAEFHHPKAVTLRAFVERSLSETGERPAPS
ncbi:tetratricopeptide repeat protein [Streptomyces sp. PT12]|uniref:ATP-binding protein n=1 Tax=Streptomyces sp. PT12 TaxID=1510197 RepID=UPI00215D55BE|nr:tetratricopeptide repeat protein [Streptomyces sp. PT12]